MSYNFNLNEKFKKYKQFFSDNSVGQILALICPYTFEIDYETHGLAWKPFSAWNYEKQSKDFVDYNIKRLKYFTDCTKELDNDYIPGFSPEVGIGVHSAYYSGHEVIMGDETSWDHPAIKDWQDMGKLKMDESNFWFRTLKDMVRYCVDVCDGDFTVSTLSNSGPGDMANALRGNDLFYDLYDEPQKVHELFDKSADAIIWLERELRKIIGTIDEGSIVANMWFPGKPLYLSEDFNDLCSAETYRKIGYRYTQKVIDAFGGAFIHHHAKGYHVHKEIASLQNLKMLEISLDPKCLRPVDHLNELFEMNNGIPLMIRCSAQDVYEKINDMKKGRIVIMLNVDSLEEGAEVMKFIRKNSII